MRPSEVIAEGGAFAFCVIDPSNAETASYLGEVVGVAEERPRTDCPPKDP